MDKHDLLFEKLSAAASLAQHSLLDCTSQDISSVVDDLRRLVETAQSAQRTAVELLRSRGESWQQVGDALGISRQSAHTTYGP